MYTVLGTDRCTRTNLRSANMCNLINVFILYLWDFCKTARLAEIPKYLINLYTLLNAILADNFPVFGEKIKNTPWKTFIYYLPLPPLLVLYTLNTLPVHWTPSLYTLDPLPVYTRHPTCIPWTPYLSCIPWTPYLSCIPWTPYLSLYPGHPTCIPWTPYLYTLDTLPVYPGHPTPASMHRTLCIS